MINYVVLMDNELTFIKACIWNRVYAPIFASRDIPGKYTEGSTLTWFLRDFRKNSVVETIIKLW